MYDVTRQYAVTLLELIARNESKLRLAKVTLGGASGSQGGGGTPPGGYDGQLAQKYVAYDTTEAASSAIVGGSGSIASLVDNLNRIRANTFVFSNTTLPANVGPTAAYGIRAYGSRDDHVHSVLLGANMSWVSGSLTSAAGTVSGTGAANRVTFWTGAASLSSSPDLTYNDTTKGFYLNGFMGIGVASGSVVLKTYANNINESVQFTVENTQHAMVISRADAGAVHMSFNNLTTGYGLAQGTDIGIEPDGTARIRQQENKPLEFYVNNVEAWTILANHNLVSGIDGTEAHAITTAGTITGNILHLSGTSNQAIFQSAGVTGTLTWTPASTNKTIAYPNSSGSIPLINIPNTFTAVQSITTADNTYAFKMFSLLNTATSDAGSYSAGVWYSLGIQSYLNLTHSTAGYVQFYGNASVIDYRGTADSANPNARDVNAYRAQVISYSSGTVGALVGFALDMRNLGTGTVTTLAAVHVPAMQNTGGGVITTTYGVKVDALGVGSTRYAFWGNNASAANVYNLYMAGTASNYLGGVLQLANKITIYNNVATEGYGVPAIVDDVALTNQGADIGATNFTNAATAGTYRLNYYLQTKVLDITAGVVTVTVGWTDNLGAKTSAFVVNMATAAQTNGVIFIRNTGANITYSSTHSGIFGLGTFDLYMTLERVS